MHIAGDAMKSRLYVAIIILIFCFSSFLIINKAEANIISVISSQATDYKDAVIILDAGHGGEDGGAVAFDGTVEKDLNLNVCRRISLLFDLFGISYVMIRSSDVSVGDTSLDTIRSRKASDIYKRYDIINSYENSVLLSIHQNMFSVEKYSGTQVFYADNDNESSVLAEIIQKEIKYSLQNDNTRKIKAAGKDIYLLYNAKRPSVMVECGFMSNPEELIMLKSDEYQTQLSYFIVKGIMQFLLL